MQIDILEYLEGVKWQLSNLAEQFGKKEIFYISTTKRDNGWFIEIKYNDMFFLIYTNPNTMFKDTYTIDIEIDNKNIDSKWLSYDEMMDFFYDILKPGL